MTNEIDFEPVLDFILIEPIKRTETEGGIALPDDVDTGMPDKGRVIKVGPGRYNEYLGDLIPMPVVVGDIVYCCFTLGGPPPTIEFNKKKLLVVRARDLIGTTGKRVAASALAAA